MWKVHCLAVQLLPCNPCVQLQHMKALEQTLSVVPSVAEFIKAHLTFARPSDIDAERHGLFGSCRERASGNIC